MNNKNHYVIIMAGGIGSRFWPMSRSKFPKQFHDILGRGKTLIQETFERFQAYIPTENIYVVTNERYKGLVQSQLPEMSDDQILLEPVGRNTAPCVAYAAYKINKINPNATFVVAPSDHLIAKEEVFRDKLLLGLNACETQDIIMTLGITPTRPDTGYGYIQFLEDDQNRGYYKVKTFTEKPELEVAESFLESGDYVWNAGIFLFSASTIRKAFESFLPEMADQFDSIVDAYYTPQEQEEVNKTYRACQNISIDFGIMEKAENVFVIPADFGWSDLGTWGSVHENSERDMHDNAAQGEAIVYDSFNNMVRTSDGKMVVLKGLEGFIVVDTEDALLICKKDDEQFIKQIVGDLKGKFGEKFV
ncbi:mannose-1-phosphate guanylyltransferase [Pontibacter sp. G13]|uniref:mannose-1-phosphate guanylyltransferase n=1 Tax=Pontibacter sp. G13 TaxID=3074898 RepID=UPI00288C455A|nr:mannose-1-phosphate guanylyltransferase [Pontibacter sp. G13]WNJ20361.1 mannose-1-phosphate guanylyltransferase [Pontibacter sp. G13]